MHSTALPTTLKDWIAHLKKKDGKRVKRVSTKRAKQLAEYHKLRGVFLQTHPNCKACLPLNMDRPARASDIHHVAGRIGAKLLDESDWLAVCRPCHDFIHRNPLLARKLGLLK